MEHGVPRSCRQRAVQRRSVCQVCHDQPHPCRDRGAVPLAQAVEHDDLRPLLHQQGNQVAADVAGAAGDEVTRCHLDLMGLGRVGCRNPTTACMNGVYPGMKSADHKLFCPMSSRPAHRVEPMLHRRPYTAARRFGLSDSAFLSRPLRGNALEPSTT